MSEKVLVIGGGIAGIQASLDLAQKGIKVTLVERTASLGGRMSQLDKTFPTLDCSICILAPKMAECNSNPNIDILTYSEIRSVEGEAPNYKVNILKKPRYVIVEKCTGCGECIEKCPIKVENEFDVSLGKRKSIYFRYLQAVPRVVTIDAKTCKKILNDKCGVCQKICTRGAIDYEMKEETLELDFGAIIVATGFDMWDATKAKEYGYGICPNVFTSLEYERMISASGPTGGHIKRRSDGNEPKKIAWIQCVGSRNTQLGQPYCCSVCCTQSTKEAILSKEHLDDVEPYIFYKDIRTFGKGFYEFKRRAEDTYRVNYVNSDATVKENHENNNPIVVYDELGKPKEIEVDMVVLAVAMVPRSDTPEIAKVLGIDIDEYGFLASKDQMFHTMETSKKGIFLAGYCKTPMDIPDSVTSASAAAAKASEMISLGGN